MQTYPCKWYETVQMVSKTIQAFVIDPTKRYKNNGSEIFNNPPSFYVVFEKCSNFILGYTKHCIQNHFPTNLLLLHFNQYEAVSLQSVAQWRCYRSKSTSVQATACCMTVSVFTYRQKVFCSIQQKAKWTQFKTFNRISWEPVCWNHQYENGDTHDLIESSQIMWK